MGRKSFGERYGGLFMTPETGAGFSDSKKKENLPEGDFGARAVAAANLKLPEKISELLGYGDVPPSSQESSPQREALMAVPRLKSRQVLLMKQIAALKGSPDSQKAVVDITESVTVINKLHSMIEKELSNRSQKYDKQKAPTISGGIGNKEKEPDVKNQLRDLERRVDAVFVEHPDIRKSFQTGWRERFGGSWNGAQNGDSYDLLHQSIPMLVKEVERYEMLAARKTKTGGTSVSESILEEKRTQVNPGEMVDNKESTNVDVYSTIRNRYIRVKEEIGQSILLNASKKNTLEYKEYQRLVQKLEPLLKDDKTIAQNYSLITAVIGMMKREASKIDGTQQSVSKENEQVQDEVTVNAKAERTQKELERALSDDRLAVNKNGELVSAVDPDSVDTHSSPSSSKRLQEKMEQLYVSSDELAQEEELLALKKAENTRKSTIAKKQEVKPEDIESQSVQTLEGANVAEPKKRTGWWNRTFLEKQQQKQEVGDGQVNDIEGVDDGGSESLDTLEANLRKKWNIDDVNPEADAEPNQQGGIAQKAEIDEDKNMNSFESQSATATGPKNRAEEDRINAEIDAAEAKFNYGHKTVAEKRNEEAFAAKNSESGGTNIRIDAKHGDVLVDSIKGDGNVIVKGNGNAVANPTVKLEGGSRGPESVSAVTEPAEPAPASPISEPTAAEAETTEPAELESAATEAESASPAKEPAEADEEGLDTSMSVVGQQEWKGFSPDTKILSMEDGEVVQGHVEPDMSVIGQEDWKRFSSNEKVSSAEDAPSIKIFGMSIPKAGPEGVLAARSFGKALEIPRHRFSKMDTSDAKLMTEKLDEAISLTRSVPEAGLQNKQVRRLEVLSKEIGAPKNYLSYSNILQASESSLDTAAAKTVAEKLPATATIESKEKKRRGRGVLRTLGLAALFAMWGTSTGDGEIQDLDGVRPNTSSGTASASAPEFPNDPQNAEVLRTPAGERIDIDAISVPDISDLTDPEFQPFDLHDAETSVAPEIVPTPPGETEFVPDNFTARVVDNSNNPEDSRTVDNINNNTGGASNVDNADNIETVSNGNDREDTDDVNDTNNNIETAETDEAVAEQVPENFEYTFTGERNSRGDVIDSVGEAALEMWERNHEVLGSTMTRGAFSERMWRTVAAIEADPVRNAEILAAMGIESFAGVDEDIDRVQRGQRVNLQPLLEAMRN